MSVNVLSLILNLKNNSFTNKVDTKKSNNRINDVGDGFEDGDDVKANNGITDKNEITVSNMEGATARISLVKSF